MPLLGDDRDNEGFLAAGFLFVIFFLYGFYYINEKITPGVGVFAPACLAANGLYLMLSIGLFKLTLIGSKNTKSCLSAFGQMGFLPLAVLVAINFRFFLVHSPNTDTVEVFFATAAFGMGGILSVALLYLAGRRLKNQSARVLLNIALGFAALVIFAYSGSPSGASFQMTKPRFSDQATANRKNVIWIVMDTARRDQISIYGDEGSLTPNIDEFARDALVMNRSISSAPWTIPSHATMFTGMFPSKHAAHRGVPGGKFTNPLSSDHLTIAEILLSYGYDTALIAGNVAGLSRNFGFSQGFNYYFDGRPIAFNLTWGKLLISLPRSFRANTLRLNEVCLSSELNALAFDWLDRRPQEEPFFLFMNYMEPHDGIEHIPEPYNSMFGYSRAEYERVFDGLEQAKVVRFEQEVTPEQLEMSQRTVARRVAFMDHNIGLLLDKLKAEGLYEDSFIIITSDHGELNGEHHSFGHNTDLYNELIWVPLIVKYPGSHKKGFSDLTVQNVDIMPELLNELNFDIPQAVQGQPFEDVSHEIIAELFEQKKAQALLYPDRYYRDLRAIFTSVNGVSLKYIWSSNGDDEIYNLEQDPKEKNNLVEQGPDIVAQLGQRLKDWRNSFDSINFSKDGHTKYSKEVEDRLRSLGYIK